MVNWKAIGFGFIVTLVLAYLGNYVPYLDIPLAPFIGGIIAGYVVGGSYRNGIINGGLSAGIVGFIYTLVVIVVTTGSTVAAAVSTAVAPTSLSGESRIVTAGIIIFGSIIAFGIYFILGLIGGIIGVAIKERRTEKPMPEPATARKSPVIPFSKENIPKCLCPTCPVQGESECAKEKMIKMQEIMQSKEEMMPEPQDFPGMYCTHGKAICADIDTSQYCICENCTVHKEYDLDHADPTFLYCKEGKAM